MNTELMSSILIYMLLPKISISIVKFKNNNAIIQFSNKSFMTYCSEDLDLLYLIPILPYIWDYLTKTRF